MSHLSCRRCRAISRAHKSVRLQCQSQKARFTGWGVAELWRDLDTSRDSVTGVSDQLNLRLGVCSSEKRSIAATSVLSYMMYIAA
jgi:hypothetical protein